MIPNRPWGGAIAISPWSCFQRIGSLIVDPWFFLRAVGIGFAVAAPIGPVGLMCIRKAMADGRMAAWMAGLGAALADTTFGAVVGLGLGAIPETLGRFESELTLFGGLFMVVLGLHSWRAAALPMEPARQGAGMLRDFLTTFLITITNPGTILGVAGVFAALGTALHPQGRADAVMLVVGILCGSSLWWAVLTELTILARARIGIGGMRLFNHVSGGLIIFFGLLALASLLIRRLL